jgi:hypothetical protein
VRPSTPTTEPKSRLTERTGTKESGLDQPSQAGSRSSQRARAGRRPRRACRDGRTSERGSRAAPHLSLCAKRCSSWPRASRLPLDSPRPRSNISESGLEPNTRGLGVRCRDPQRWCQVSALRSGGSRSGFAGASRGVGESHGLRFQISRTVPLRAGSGELLRYGACGAASVVECGRARGRPSGAASSRPRACP